MHAREVALEGLPRGPLSVPPPAPAPAPALGPIAKSIYCTFNAASKLDLVLRFESNRHYPRLSLASSTSSSSGLLACTASERERERKRVK